MIKTHLKVALRNLLRNRAYALLNIGGLSVGLACALIIFLYIRHELSFDDYHIHKDRVYRLASLYTTNEDKDLSARSSPTIGKLLQAEIPGIESVFRMRYLPRMKMQAQQSSFFAYEEMMFLADSNVTDVFSLKFLAGDSATCLTAPNSIVLTRSLAEKYFGQQDPVGDTLLASNQFKYVVTAVIEDLPENTHHRFSALLAYDTYKTMDFGDRDGYNVSLWVIRDYVFLRFAQDYDVGEFYAAFPAFYERHMAKIGKETNGSYVPILEPLEDTHMNPNRLEFDYFDTGNSVYIYAFSAVGGFVLLLACINYMNMATARSNTRSREVGLRKVLGSRRSNLVAQFLGESILMTLMALLFALCITEVVLELTPFNALMGKTLRLDLFEDPAILLWSVAAAVVLGTLSGLYPAVFMSSFQPADALRGRGIRGRTATTLRKAMVMVQFTIAIGVIICTFLMRNQVEFMRNVDLGFKSENIVVIPVNDTITRDHLPEIRAQIEAHPHVRATTTARNVPGHSIGRMFMRVIRPDSMEDVVMDVMSVGQDYVEGMGLEIVRGRDFGPESMGDSTAEFLVNETAARQLFQDSAIGEQMIWGLPIGAFSEHKGPVVGVLRDFTVHSLHYQRRPLVLVPSEYPGGLLHVRMDGDSIVQTMAHIHKVWEPYEANGSPFNYFFIDESFDRLYEADQRHSRLMGILAYICMVISALGLIGFASYSIVQRRKEIGIRKVMGASVLRILLWLFTDIFYLVLVASFAGSVLALVVFRIWLGEFAYHAEIPFGTFFFTGLGVLLAALITVGLHSLRAASERPIHALRVE